MVSGSIPIGKALTRKGSTVREEFNQLNSDAALPATIWPLNNTPLGVVVKPLQSSAYAILLEQEYSQYAGAGREEMSGIVICVEANKIAVEHPLQYLISDWQNSVNFTAGERCM